MGQLLGNGGFVLDKPEEISLFQLLSMKGRLKMEIKFGGSFSSRGPATSTIVRGLIGSKTRNKKKLLEELEAEIEKKKAGNV